MLNDLLWATFGFACGIPVGYIIAHREQMVSKIESIKRGKH